MEGSRRGHQSRLGLGFSARGRRRARPVLPRFAVEGAPGGASGPVLVVPGALVSSLFRASRSTIPISNLGLL